MFKPAFQSFGTLTTPATVTRSMGLPSDARAGKFFAASFAKFIWTWQISATYRDCKKLASPDTVGN